MKKSSICCLVAAMAAPLALGFVSSSALSQRQRTALFASAEVSKMATEQTRNLRAILGPLAAPPELEALEEGVKKDLSNAELGERMFLLLIKMTLDYKTDPASQTVQIIDHPGETLEKTDDLQGKMQYLYTYGVRMMTTGLIDVDTLKEIVETKCAKRVGLTGQELDDWVDV